MRLLGILTVSLITFVGHTQTTISGNLENGGNKKLYLYKLSQNEPVVVDSVVTKADGSFSLKHKTGSKDFYRFGPDVTSFALLVIGTGKENIEIKGSADDLTNSYSVSGSEDNILIHEFLTRGREYIVQRDSLNKLFRAPGANQLDLKNQINQLGFSFIAYRDQFIKDHQNSPAALITLQYINPQQDTEQFRVVAEGAQKSMPGSFYAEGLKQQLAGMIIPGNLAPEIAYPDTSGNVRKLSDLRGKVVLIDFWASWCGPCRKENPHVVKLYKKYNSQGFEVFSVSLDQQENRWEQAIVADGLIWPNHVSDLKQWKSEPARRYGVTGIPYTVLIDGEGRIIATKLRGHELEAKLQEIFGS